MNTQFNPNDDIQNKKRYLKLSFLVIAVISCFTCYARADYNLPLFAFSYLLWDQINPCDQKTRLLYLFIFTWIFDFVWLIYWGSFWDSDKLEQSWAKGVQSFVLILSIINFIIKLGVIVFCWVVEQKCKEALKPDIFIKNIQEMFKVEAERLHQESKH
ncbi:transmembrane protein, putative (macronuclear) [Tetrahymena thermophila SB210]|uniref:Transmembrane protein, putative n=1 Tax=Tetrahymena thermophila (strain SB210) TaxID=312017 RepID=Q22GY0_TETTS|nr:transmembrane protein, putative [Tetrahymena thermophila SB210]EAR84544.1 transmembrane protein, putative [Tetrahymena thermophila SB210]|eukprot:XP_001032207.1 transmembrane protein, putative [Tetrahymena thermophila SB210]